MLAPDKVHVPEPDLVTEMISGVDVFDITPAISPVPVVDPCMVNVLTPVEVDVLLVNFIRPLPDWSMVALPVDPAI